MEGQRGDGDQGLPQQKVDVELDRWKVSWIVSGCTKPNNTTRKPGHTSVLEVIHTYGLYCTDLLVLDELAHEADVEEVPRGGGGHGHEFPDGLVEARVGAISDMIIEIIANHYNVFLKLMY